MFYIRGFLSQSCENGGQSDGWKQIVILFECTRARCSCTIKGNLYAFLGG